MRGSEITIPGPDGSFCGYLARPQSGRGPGVVVLQEIFGVNAFVRETADWLADNGYVALAPDLFWRIQHGVELTDQSQDHWDRAFELFRQFDVEAGVRDIVAAIAVLRATPGCTGKVGAIGYCLGGLLAYLTAARTTSDASVGYYGVSLQDRLAEAANISKPLVLHIADEDAFTPPEARDAIVAGLAPNERVTLFRYPGEDHAFARTGGEHFSPSSAALANDRTLAFFRSALG